MVLVDSSIWIEALRRQGRLDVKVALEALLESYEAQLCAPVRLEVMGGSRKEERRVIGSYFSNIPYRPVSPEDWERAISLSWRLRDRGLTVPWLDVLIASELMEAARAVQRGLVTQDRTTLIASRPPGIRSAPCHASTHTQRISGFTSQCTIPS